MIIILLAIVYLNSSLIVVLSLIVYHVIEIVYEKQYENTYQYTFKKR